MAENANFSPKETDECLQNFEIFGKNEFLETSDNLHDNNYGNFWPITHVVHYLHWHNFFV